MAIQWTSPSTQGRATSPPDVAYLMIWCYPLCSLVSWELVTTFIRVTFIQVPSYSGLSINSNLVHVGLKENRKDCPHTDVNAITIKNEQGSKDGSGMTPLCMWNGWTQRRFLSAQQSTQRTMGMSYRGGRNSSMGLGERWRPPVPHQLGYNAHMGGVDRLDQIRSSITQHNTKQCNGIVNICSSFSGHCHHKQLYSSQGTVCCAQLE